MLRVVAAALACRLVHGSWLAADSAQSLDSTLWTASSSDGTVISASVPGDVISDLSAAGVIPPPFLDLTWREQAGRWDLATWTFSITFDDEAVGTDTALCAPWLVFESVKMAADVTLNGVLLGAVTNQHLRGVFPLAEGLLHAAGNILSVAFPPTVEDVRNDEGRYMGSSGGE